MENAPLGLANSLLHLVEEVLSIAASGWDYANGLGHPPSPLLNTHRHAAPCSEGV